MNYHATHQPRLRSGYFVVPLTQEKFLLAKRLSIWCRVGAPAFFLGGYKVACKPFSKQRQRKF